MEIPGWVFVLTGAIVAVISLIIYANTGSFQLFIVVGVIFLIYGLGKMVVTKMRSKNEDQLNKEMEKYSKPTTFKDLPIGKEYYRQQYGPQQNMQNNAQGGFGGQMNQQRSQQQMPRPMQQTHTNMHTARPAQHQTMHGQQPHGANIKQQMLQSPAHAQRNSAQMAHQSPAQRSHPSTHQGYHSPYAYCAKCGQRNHANVNFCANCGGRMR